MQARYRTALHPENFNSLIKYTNPGFDPMTFLTSVRTRYRTALYPENTNHTPTLELSRRPT
ncbi:hypothetical protein [Lunatibacter salilacus]|uniref:hypothetical protein n=1 Tax=Lunatibacter salilacus TaxID=2483804 RepID=UPI00131CC1D6|nr:hypothetical protein [Lunatibacter salilacus]